MAALQPVVPEGYQSAGILGPAPMTAVMPTREQLQAQINSRLGTPAPAPTMRTAAEMQADITARMGPGYSGPQYGGAGLGAVNPVVPAGYIQQGNRLISPSVQAVQAAQQTPGPTSASQQRGLDSEARQAQMYQDILGQHKHAMVQANQAPADIKQQVINGMLATGQPYTGQGTWSADGRSYTPSAVERGIGTMGRAGTGNLMNNTTRDYARRYGVGDKIEDAAKSFAVTPELLKRMTNNPELAQRFYSGGKSIEGNFMQKVSQDQARKRKAYEDMMAPINARNSAKLNSVPGFFGSAGNIGNVLKGMNPLRPVTNIASGQGGINDYMRIAKFFL